MSQEQALAQSETLPDRIRACSEMEAAERVCAPHHLALWASEGSAVPTLASSLLIADYVSVFLRALHRDVEDALQQRLPGFDDVESLDGGSMEQLQLALADVADEPFRRATLEQCTRDLVEIIRRVAVQDTGKLERLARAVVRQTTVLERALAEDTSPDERASYLFEAADFLAEELSVHDLLRPSMTEVIDAVVAWERRPDTQCQDTSSSGPRVVSLHVVSGASSEEPWPDRDESEGAVGRWERNAQ